MWQKMSQDGIISTMIIVTGTIAYDYVMDFPGKFGDHILPEKSTKLIYLSTSADLPKGGAEPQGMFLILWGFCKLPTFYLLQPEKIFKNTKKILRK